MYLDADLRRSIAPEAELGLDVAWHCTVFPQPVEHEFLRQTAESWLRIARLWLLETFALGFAMAWIAALSSRKAMAEMLMLHSLVGVLAMLCAFRILPRLPPGRQRDLVFGAVAVSYVCCISLEGWWMSAAYANRYVMASGLSLFTILVIVPLRLRQSAVVAVVGMAALAPITLLSSNPAQRACWDLLGFTALMLPIGLRVRATAERDQRRLFLLRRREELQRQSLARANTRLQELSRTDPLTGVANRRSFDAALRQSLDPALGRLPLLLMLDVDHFKRFNDTYGHPRGDHCLRLVAGALRAQLRTEGDLAARIGGEEFALLLPGGTEADALDVAERIRLAVEALQLPHSGRPDHPPIVTVSVGAATATDHDTAETLLARADAALYAAKKAGRNQVRAASASPPGHEPKTNPAGAQRLHQA